VCGHWSTLGVFNEENVAGIDAGCVWGGRLCALRLDAREPVVQITCAQHQKPGDE
jgi:bis(5'-nucleosyl)-tetraphosphatase (symmetrical)